MVSTSGRVQKAEIRASKYKGGKVKERGLEPKSRRDQKERPRPGVWKAGEEGTETTLMGGGVR